MPVDDNFHIDIKQRNDNTFIIVVFVPDMAGSVQQGWDYNGIWDRIQGVIFKRPGEGTRPTQSQILRKVPQVLAFCGYSLYNI